MAHRVAVDRHGDLHPDLHARLWSHGVGMDLASGRRSRDSRQCGGPRPHRAQLLCGHALRHSLPRARARVVWRAGSQYPGAAARTRGVRLVRHPDVDRRLGDLQADRSDLARHRDAAADPAGIRRSQHRRGSLLHAVLGDERLDRAARDGLDQVSGDVGITVLARRRRGAVHLGMGSRRWHRSNAPKPRRRAVRPSGGREPLRRWPHLRRRVLGHDGALDPRLLPLCAIPARSDRGPGGGLAGDHGAVRIHRGRRYERDRPHLRPTDR